jgi:putative nucleotidyltransferase with HDIG domain
VDETRDPSASLWHRIGTWGPLVALVVVSAVLAVAILLLPLLPGEQAVSHNLGEVAAQDILAPRSVTFVSTVLSEQARQVAADAVTPVYDPPDPSIARQQAERLRASLAYISAVRSDAFATPEQKLADLHATRDISISTESATQLLQLSDVDWQLVQNESQVVLEQVMRREIRPESVEEIRGSLPAYVSLELPENRAQLVANLLSPLIIPNSIYNEGGTQALREEAARSVAPITRSYVAGQVVVARGRPVTPSDLEAVQALGLTPGPLDVRETLSTILTVALLATLLLLYLQRFPLARRPRFRHAALLAVLLLIYIAAARLMIPSHTVLPYLFPAASLALCLAGLFNPGLGIIGGFLIASVAGVLAGGRLELSLFTGLGALMAVLTLGRAERPLNFFFAGLTSALTGIAVILISRLLEPTSDLLGVLTLTAASLGNGVLSGSMAIGILLLAGSTFDITTNLQLLELSRPDHPLLRLMLRNAPGTYQHSLQVANLAEHAGESIAANTLLLRVGALYHDAGKASRPKYFVENQGPDGNPHERLEPDSSAKLIIEHVRDGLELARKYRLPTRVRDLIPEHHGTLRANFQYNLALKSAEGDASKVDESLFHYPGPRPRSREAALLMLADGVEAKFRAVGPTSQEEIEALVRSVIDDRLSQQQFVETDLTLQDLERIRRSFVETLRGSLHTRLKYPDDVPAKTQPVETPPHAG